MRFVVTMIDDLWQRVVPDYISDKGIFVNTKFISILVKFHVCYCTIRYTIVATYDFIKPGVAIYIITQWTNLSFIIDELYSNSLMTKILWSVEDPGHWWNSYL